MFWSKCIAVLDQEGKEREGGADQLLPPPPNQYINLQRVFLGPLHEDS